MADITTIAPITVRGPRLPKLGLPLLGLVLAVGKLFQAYGDTVSMAYANPFRSNGTRATPLPDEDLEGRDPNW